MKNLKLLNKNFIITIFTIFILSITKVSSEEATDIWSLNNETENTNIKDNQSTTTSEINVLDNKKDTKDIVSYVIAEDDDIKSKNIEILGLYDPGENDFELGMWINSDGEKIDNLIKKLHKLNLSKDAKEIYLIGIELDGTNGMIRDAEKYLLGSGMTKVSEKVYDVGMLLIKYSN